MFHRAGGGEGAGDGEYGDLLFREEITGGHGTRTVFGHDAEGAGGHNIAYFDGHGLIRLWVVEEWKKVDEGG